MTIIDKLNIKRQLLNQADLAILLGKAAGETHRFNKKITLDWFGEKKRVNLVIAVTPRGEPEGQPAPPMPGEEEGWNPT